MSTGRAAEASLSDLTKPPSHRVIDQGLGFAPHKASVSEQTQSPGSCCCPQLCRWDMLREPCVPREHHCTCAQSMSPAHLANWRGIVAAERTLISSHPLIFSGLCPSIKLSRKPRLKPGFASEDETQRDQR